MLFRSRMFVWDNLLLCCTECGRLKGNRFPLDTDRPLLIDPTLDEPWEHLDFDPATGNIVARFDTRTNDWSPKGTETVKILHLDQREAMASGYTRTFRRISDVVQRALRDEAPVVADLYAALGEADDHGLLGWCFVGTGMNVSPFQEFRTRFPDVWAACAISARQ